MCAMIVNGVKGSTQIKERNSSAFNGAEFARSHRELIGPGDFDQLGHHKVSLDSTDGDLRRSS